ncbi:hypothetical protein KFE96_04205 [Kordiimonas sp. SCSIO 12603]|uniref:hypothetical protein n=1 Tax=Kordiimonas sp. SCSIO 12603 TaxID=2829596 RepID=UPI002104EB06|nr:hypothetical protein [Kordiimonas sp. SCSIO 12603]UTW59514.1 hypothetical protein KFE96_04205 [Kordiimonas sp. SCSIO 12603]
MDIFDDGVGVHLLEEYVIYERVESGDQLVFKMLEVNFGGELSYEIEISCDYEVSSDRLVTKDCEVDTSPAITNGQDFFDQIVEDALQGVWARKY